MSLDVASPARSAPSVAAGGAAAGGAASPPPPSREPRSRFALLSAALMLVAAVALGFATDVVVLSQVFHARAQHVLLSDFREELANATAPVGQTDLDGALLAPGTPVAIMRVPSVGIDEVVVEGTTSGDLMSGPGHKRDTVLPGQPGVSVIYGRQAAYGGPFARAQDLLPQDLISVTTGQGDLQFSVMGVRRAGDPLPPPLRDGESRLVLVSAEGPPFLPDGVLRVDATLVGQPQPAPARVVVAVTESEQPMQGDPAAWFGVVLWTQALLLTVLLVTWAWIRWGRWQAWVIGIPLLLFVGIGTSQQVTQLLPNLI